MGAREAVAVRLGEAARWAARTLARRGGGNVPGAVALKVAPDLLESLAGALARGGCAVVTGTNGKTTTANLLADCLEASGMTVVANRAGDNMEAGIAAAAIEGRRRMAAEARRSGKVAGCFECDELYTARVVPKLKPTVFVLLNLFRDQLDRCGEINRAQDAVVRALEGSPETVLLFNADDPLCAAVARRVANRSVALGFDGPTPAEPGKELGGRVCAACGAELEYAYVQYGQLGAWSCPSCGLSRPSLDAAARDIRLEEAGYSFLLDLSAPRAAGGGGAGAPSGEQVSVRTPYREKHMAYNVAAAFSAAWLMGVPADRLQPALDRYRPPRGRMQSFSVGGRRVVANLAKNPVGFDRTLQLVANSGAAACAFFVNDADADGHDVSWLWDVDFEFLQQIEGVRLYAGGSRAEEVRLRLKYAGLRSEVVPCVAAALERCGLGAGETFCAVGNYTAMPALCDELERLADAGGAAPGAYGGGSRAACAVGRPDAPSAGCCREGRKTSATLASSAAAPGFEALADRPLRVLALYPFEMNLYGDMGNATVLLQRCLWRGIPAEVSALGRGASADFAGADIVLFGGGADRDQEVVQKDLLAHADELRAYIARGGVLLAVCGGYQLLGRGCVLGGRRVPGAGVLGAETAGPSDGEGRLVGNARVRSEIVPDPLLGFENHAGRTWLDQGEEPLGAVDGAGAGNNGVDGGEGVLAGGVVGTYLHGPVLAKNPQLADWLIARALGNRGVRAPLVPLDDGEELAARAEFEAMLARGRR